MKKTIYSIALVLVFCLSGCDEEVITSTDISNMPAVTTSDPSYSVIHSSDSNTDDDGSEILQYDWSATLIRCGDSYLKIDELSENQHNISEIDISMPKELRPSYGQIIQLMADTRITSGGYNGDTIYHIYQAEDVKEYKVINYTDDYISDLIPLWIDVVEQGQSYFDWKYLSGTETTFRNTAAVFKYAENGDIYSLGRIHSNFVIFQNGQLIGTYEKLKVKFFDIHQEYGIVLCNSDFNLDNLVSNVQRGMLYDDSYFYLGTTNYNKTYRWTTDYFPLMENATIEKEKLVMRTDEDMNYLIASGVSACIDDVDYTSFLIKSDTPLYVTSINIGEKHQLNFILKRYEESTSLQSGYSVIRIKNNDLNGVNISDFKYIIV